MAEFLSVLDRGIPVIDLDLSAFTFCCGIVGFARQFRISPKARWSDPVFRAASSGFIGSIMLMGALTLIYKYKARAEIATYCAAGVESMTVDARPFVPADVLVSKIAASVIPWGHHSHPTKMLRVRLVGPKGTLDLALGRDSDDKHEYWLFYPHYYITSDNEVGHIFTDQLDGF